MRISIYSLIAVARLSSAAAGREPGKTWRSHRSTARNPLGFVAHKEHLNRIDYLARKVFNLPRHAVVHIVAPGIDKTSSGIPESLTLPVTRLAFAGAIGADSLRRRQRLLVALNRTLPRRMKQPS
jgi:hypothetical protein